MRRLQAKAKPNARESALEEQPDGTWLARLKSPPVDGKANAELVALVAERFGCRKADVRIKSGAGGRLKLVEILGFTAIEMMIVLAVIAILVMMAVPTYQEKAIRDQITEALPIADLAKAPVAAAWAALQKFPDDNAAAGLPVADKIVGNFVSSVRVEKGAIHVTFGNRVNAGIKGKVLTLRPAVVADAPVVPVAWVCGMASVPDKMTVQGENRTDVPAQFLPFRCR